MRDILCYSCKYRGEIPGDAHSCCLYPGNDTNIFSIFSETNREQALRLGIKAELHGIQCGWFMWPINFDPVWLRNCNGYTREDADQ